MGSVTPHAAEVVREGRHAADDSQALRDLPALSEHARPQAGPEAS